MPSSDPFAVADASFKIEPDELIPGRREARLRVIAAGLSDEDIDRLIKQAQAEAQPLLR